MSEISPPLSQGVGYGVVIGVGLAFAAALLSAVLVAYQYGISGPFWYGAGCSPMIVCFAYLGTVCKRRVPSAHTVLEIIKLRYALTSPEVGSIGGLYDLVVEAQPNHVIDGNYQGSLLTMTSQQGIFFAIILLVSNFGAVIMDTGYFTKAFAASPEGVVPGYVIGGLSYFSIPWALGTVMGMVTLGLETTKAFPTYPRVSLTSQRDISRELTAGPQIMTSSEVTNGLALPYAAIAVAGKGGAVATLLMTFMAVTSTLSAQVIAVSSIVAFDVYRSYFNTSAGNKESRVAVIASAYLGLATGLAVWLGTAHRFYGAVTVASTGQTLPCMYGTVASAFSPLLYSVLITYLGPEDFDWTSLSKTSLAVKTIDEVTDNIEAHAKFDGETDSSMRPQTTEINDECEDASEAAGRRWSRYALFWAIATFLGHWVLWPLPMYAAKFVFSKGLFVAWIVVAEIWLWVTLLIVGFYPLWNGRHKILLIARSITVGA
ncbi:Urea active transporter [Penicillium subrubescens]|uniref:Urea active transporter n=1 Tax=Penicillium subrubescens TaxID=1316194 RepID=A0A1Q5UE13_9EURO|nr:Urea active transporter [Penicillium subrubescens]